MIAYFPNGTAAEIYQAEWCDHCAHGQDDENGCPVMTAHWLRNYDDHSKPQSILHVLIPMDDDHNPKECAMFVPVSALREPAPPEQQELPL